MQTSGAAGRKLRKPADNEAAGRGLRVNAAAERGLHVPAASDAAGRGLRIPADNEAAGCGLRVNAAAERWLRVNAAAGRGLQVPAARDSARRGLRLPDARDRAHQPEWRARVQARLMRLRRRLRSLYVSTVCCLVFTLKYWALQQVAREPQMAFEKFSRGSLMNKIKCHDVWLFRGCATGSLDVQILYSIRIILQIFPIS